MRTTKWERLLESKPIAIMDHLIAEAARLFADDLKVWPPQIDELDTTTGSKVGELIKGAPLRPDPRVYQVAFGLTKWDLSREHEAYDDFMRNERWREGGLTAKDKDMSLFLSRFMTEQVLALGEATDGRVNRQRMLDIVERVQRLFLQEYSS